MTGNFLVSWVTASQEKKDSASWNWEWQSCKAIIVSVCSSEEVFILFSAVKVMFLKYVIHTMFVRFDVFIVMRIKVMVFWVMMPCNEEVGYPSRWILWDMNEAFTLTRKTTTWTTLYLLLTNKMDTHTHCIYYTVFYSDQHRTFDPRYTTKTSFKFCNSFP